MSRFLRSATSKVFWSRTDRMLRPRRSWIGAKTTLASRAPSAPTMASSSSSEPARCGLSETFSFSGSRSARASASSHSSSSFFGTSVCTRCWCCVEPLPIALVVEVRPDDAT